jgi:SGNH hydrolase-like domain, acetyltransferase AlgX
MTSRGAIPRIPRRGRLLRWAVAVMVSLPLIVVGAEVVVRRFPPLMPVEKQLAEYAIHSPYHEDVLDVPDSDVGFLVHPGQHRVIQTRDYVEIYETDRKGFPNAEPWPNPVAMVFLGDSLVVGTGVNLSASFPRLIAERLQMSEVNLGLVASGPERQLAVYRTFGMSLHPRHVVTVLYLASDFENDRHFSSWIAAGQTGNYNDFRLGMARAATDTRRANLKGYAEKSWVYVLCRNFIRRLLGLRDFPERYRFADGSEVLFSRNTVEFAMAEAALNDLAVERLMASLEKMRNVVVQSGSTLSVVLLPSKEELFAVPPAATTANLVSRARERLLKAGFAVLDLYPAIRDAGLSKSPYFRTDAHFNEYGHRVVAEAFVAWFRHTFPPTSPMAASGRPR